MQNRLDPGSKIIAAQEFHHMAQKPTELVTDFIRRLEQAFWRAYGREQMTTETRDALLQGQLQEGLQYAMVMAPAVSGARTYQELCIATKNEEHRQLALAQRQNIGKDRKSYIRKVDTLEMFQPQDQAKGIPGYQQNRDHEKPGSVTSVVVLII